MGTVQLTRDHHNLREQQNMERWVLLTPELLARPIVVSAGKPIPKLHQGMARGALQGLLDLQGFNAAVSYGVTDDGRNITVPNRVWGTISAGTPGGTVANFSHDSRHKNRPFRILIQWLEEHCLGKDETSQAYNRFLTEWSSSEKWRLLFESRIRRNLGPLRARADSMRIQADELESRVTAIEAALVVKATTEGSTETANR